MCFFPPAALAIFLCRLFESKCKNDTEDYGAYLLLSLIMLFMTWNNQISANFFFLLHLNVKVMLKESWRHRNKQWNWNRFVLQKKNGSAADSIRFNGLSLVLLATYISHTIIWTACNYLPPNKRDDPEPSDAIAKATEVGYFHLVNKHRFFFSLFTIAIIHPANISLFVLHIVCCFISFFHFFFLLSFHSFNEEHSGCDSLYAYK